MEFEKDKGKRGKKGKYSNSQKPFQASPKKKQKSSQNVQKQSPPNSTQPYYLTVLRRQREEEALKSASVTAASAAAATEVELNGSPPINTLVEDLKMQDDDVPKCTHPRLQVSLYNRQIYGANVRSKGRRLMYNYSMNDQLFMDKKILSVTSIKKMRPVMMIPSRNSLRRNDRVNNISHGVNIDENTFRIGSESSRECVCVCVCV
jgi:hypothetical protein